MTELLNRPHAATAAAAERVFGRSRLRMATGAHVDVFREASRPGERRRYTKRFLATPNGDYRRWTEREWRLLARLVGHGVVAVPEIVRFDRGVDGEPALIQTYDAGVTVDHWATLLPVRRGTTLLRHAFEDAPHWFALARHALAALDAVHALALVHLDLKADNVCIPAAPAGFDPHEGDGAVRLEVGSLALIDFAFALVSGERLATALPIARQPDYDYQSPRLLAALEHGLRGDLGPTRELDWRCDFYSLAAMLERYLPAMGGRDAGVWTPSALGEARRFVAELRVIHDSALPAMRPHARLIDRLDARLSDPEWAGSIARGFTLDVAPGDTDAGRNGRDAGDPGPTPVTRIAPALGWATAPTSDALTAAEAELPRALDEPATARSGTRADIGSGPGFDSRGVAASGQAAEPSDRASTTGIPAITTDAQPAERHALSVDPEDAAAMGSLHLRPHTDPGARRRRPLVLAAVAALAVPLFVGAWWHLAEERDAQRARAALASAVVTAPTAAPPQPSGVEPPVPGDRPVTATSASVSPSAAADGLPVSGGSPGLDTRPPTVATVDTGMPAEAVVPGVPGVGADAAVPAASATPRPGPAVAAAPAPGARRPPTAVTSPRGTPAAPVPAAAPPRIATRTSPNGTASVVPPRRLATAAPAPRRVTDALSPPRPAAAPPVHTSVLSRAHTAALAAAGRSTVPAAPSAAPAPAAVGPATASPLPTTPRSSTDAASPARSGAQAAPAASAMRPDEGVAVPRSDADHGRRGAELIATELPRSAQRAERLVLRVLHVAGQGGGTADDESVRQAARAIRLAPGDPALGPRVSSADARRLGDAARAALRRGAPLGEAVSLQTRAFGADPEDAEIAGTLAAWTLLPPSNEPQLARQLALHALTLHDPRHPQGRLEDWATLAIASSLAGRSREAQGAWAVVLAVASATGQEGRACRAGLDAVARHGERLRAPVESMLQRLQGSRGMAAGMAASPFCEWPPHWQAAVREPGPARP